MTIADLSTEITSYLQRLFPLTRSLTGEGNRQTLSILQDIAPIEIIEYPSGMEVYDWVIPDEWIIRDAAIILQRMCDWFHRINPIGQISVHGPENKQRNRESTASAMHRNAEFIQPAGQLDGATKQRSLCKPEDSSSSPSVERAAVNR